MTQSYDELLDMVLQLRKEVNDLTAVVTALALKVDAQSAPAGKGWVSPVTFSDDSYNKLTERMTMPANAMREMLNGVSDRDLQTITREDRIAGKTIPGKS
jgi:hypothetical protein